MNWLEALSQTYDNCASHIGDARDKTPLLPTCHSTQNAHIEVAIDQNGSFLRAKVLAKDEAVTVIPCTEAGGGRAGAKPTCHPLCDKLQYLAGDFLPFGGDVTSGFTADPGEPHRIYKALLSDWCKSPYGNQMAISVFEYIRKGTLIADLCKCDVLPKDEATGKLIKEWKGSTDSKPAICLAMPAGATPDEAFVRWAVEIPGESQARLDTNKTVWKSWTNYYNTVLGQRGLCYVSGEQIPLAIQHPAKLRNAGDKAKLISANDGSGYTFRGRFTDDNGEQACGVGFEVTQKAHNALRWLIARQGYRFDTQAIVAWSIEGRTIPDPMGDSLSVLFPEMQNAEGKPDSACSPSTVDDTGGQEFAARLRAAIAGYGKELSDNSGIVVLALDSATPGRMSITYYRELQASEFLDQIETWHESCSWWQNFGKDRRFFGAPAPRDIAEVAYGRRLDDRLRSATVRRLLPCIIDGVAIPRDLVESCVHRAANRSGLEHWEWEKALGIACALYRKLTSKERNYDMDLDTTCDHRDYLYGRLLALAEHLESRALYIAGENRDTTAAKLMQRFAEHPFSTWRSIELALVPSATRLRAMRPGFLFQIQQEMDAAVHKFKTIADYNSDAKLSGEFLLGYHLQRHDLRKKPNDDDQNDTPQQDQP